MKYCPKCERDLPKTAFAKHSKRKDGLQSWCRECKAAKHQERRDHNCQTVYNRRKQIAGWLKEYKQNHPCERCGESHIACLQFHHNNPKEKDLEVSNAVHNGWSIRRLEEEISKCTVLCANCHCKEHFATLV